MPPRAAAAGGELSFATKTTASQRLRYDTTHTCRWLRRTSAKPVGFVQVCFLVVGFEVLNTIQRVHHASSASATSVTHPMLAEDTLLRSKSLTAAAG